MIVELRTMKQRTDAEHHRDPKGEHGGRKSRATVGCADNNRDANRDRGYEAPHVENPAEPRSVDGALADGIGDSHVTAVWSGDASDTKSTATLRPSAVSSIPTR